MFRLGIHANRERVMRHKLFWTYAPLPYHSWLSLTAGFPHKIGVPNNYCVLHYHEPVHPSIRPGVCEPTYVAESLNSIRLLKGRIVFYIFFVVTSYPSTWGSGKKSMAAVSPRLLPWSWIQIFQKSAVPKHFLGIPSITVHFTIYHGDTMDAW
jgi:hypothetical protein